MTCNTYFSHVTMT